MSYIQTECPKVLHFGIFAGMMIPGMAPPPGSRKGERMELYFSSFSLQLRYCRRFAHSGHWRLERTWPDYSLYCILTGEAVLTVDGREYRAGAGDAVLLFPGDHGTVASEQGCSFLFAAFRVDVGNDHHLFFRLNSAGVYSSPEICGAGQSLCRAFPPEANPLRFSPRQYGAFSCFLAELVEQSGSHQAIHPAAPRYSDWKLNQLLGTMARSSPEILPIRQLAGQMEMSEKYFIRYFRTQVGCTPGQYMNRLRMERAADLLADPGLTLEEAAQQLHYADAYSFSKAFRKYYGEPPGAFREHMK